MAWRNQHKLEQGPQLVSSLSYQRQLGPQLTNLREGNLGACHLVCQTKVNLVVVQPKQTRGQIVYDTQQGPTRLSTPWL